MKILSVNKILTDLASFEGKDITVGGILCFEFENCSIEHHPKSERIRDFLVAGHACQPSIWISVGSGSLSLNARTLKKWSGKRVVVEGTILIPDSTLGGCGHMSAWPAEILARSIELENLYKQH